MTKEHLLELRIIQPGGITGRYLPEEGAAWRLEEIVPPVEALPFDVAVLPEVWTPFNEPFRVVVLGSISHPADTLLEGRLLGAFRRGEEPPFLVAVPEAEPEAPQAWGDVPAPRREAVLAALRRARPGEWRWLEVEEVEPCLHEGARRYREHGAAAHRRHAPAWQALRSAARGGYTDAEQYTAAEYTFFELPYRFQEYVGDALAADERILYAARRPAMPSQRQRSWLRRERLQEGVLLLTTHRLIHLAELIPPDAANIRYGFREVIGVLERLRGVDLQPLGSHLALTTRWAAASGEAEMVWESPAYTRTALQDLLDLLAPVVSPPSPPRALQRATPPPLPETLKPLVDTASNDPEESRRLSDRFRPLLEAALEDGERPYAWAALPKWFQPKVGTQVLVATDRRLFLLPGLSLNVALRDVAVWEYTSSIVDSYLAFIEMRAGKAQQHVVRFPYPAKPAFRACFESAWRCAAVLPV